MISPIVLFTYNRLWHTEQTIKAIKENELAHESELIVFSDGAKSEKDEPMVEAVREFIGKMDGFKGIRLIKRKKNHGLAQNIIDGVSSIVDEFGRAIVLEDDLITSRYFLEYMNSALEIYRNEERVISVHGFMYPVEAELPETFFIKGADCWGWATWKRGWDLFVRNGEELLSQIEKKKLKRQFDFDNSYPYLKMLENQIAGKNDSWAIRWYASAFLADKLTLYPGRSLVRNIGLDGSGTHCGKVDLGQSLAPERRISIEKIDTAENAQARKSMVQYFKRTNRITFRKLIASAIGYRRK